MVSSLSNSSSDNRAGTPTGHEEAVGRTPEGRAPEGRAPEAGQTVVKEIPEIPTRDCFHDYQFLNYAGPSLLGDSWKVRSPEGRMQSIQFIAGMGKLHLWARNDLKFSERLRAVRHPALLPMETIKKVRGRVVLLSDWAEQSLRDRLEQCRREGQAGIPRAELLGYLRTAADALDYLQRQHGIQHLGINPLSLRLHEGRLFVADFGLVQFLWIPSGRPLAELNPRYAAPELRRERVSRSCDSYSLARVYVEMLTGKLADKNELDSVPFEERETLARALSAEPEQRFASCLELVQALEEATAGSDAVVPAETLAETPAPRRKVTMVQAAPPVGDALPLATGHTKPPSPEQLIADLVHQSMSDCQIQECEGMRFQFLADGTMQHKCAAWLPPEVAQQKLDGFFQQWQPHMVRTDKDTYVFRMPMKSSFWQRLTGKHPGIEFTIQLANPFTHSSKLTEITVRMRFRDGKESEARHVLAQFGPVLLNSLRTYLLALPEQRIHERFPFEHTLRITPLSGPRRGKPVKVVSRDISLGGLSLYVPGEPASADVVVDFPIYLPSLEVVSVAIPGRIQRVSAADDSHSLVGVQFLLNRPRQRGQVLLIARDAESLRRQLQNIPDTSFQVECAEALTPGLERLAKGGVDVVLFDVRERQELQDLRKIRSLVQEVPLVVLSDDAELAAEALREGADEHLSRQGLSNELLARKLKAALARQRSLQHETLKKERERIVAQLKLSQLQEHHLAYHDALTDLPNRQLFYSQLNQTIARAAQQNRLAVVMFLDLDGFKRINDTQGHAVGDSLLKAVAQRLRGCVRESDTVARLGGDEFTISLGDITNIADATQVAQKLLRVLAKPISVDGRDLSVTSSIGISCYPTDGADAETLVQKADLAMYRAKGQGKNNFQQYHPSLEAKQFERLNLENELRQALERNELVLHYQPQLDLRRGGVHGVEALVRWQHPQWGLLPPARFLPLAEDAGLLVAIDERVLRLACQQNQAWQAAGHAPVRVSVNVSTRMFHEKNLREILQQVLAETRLAPHYLGLEITEDGAMQDVSRALTIMKSLKELGVTLLIDSFGQGQSSLHSLKSWPVDILKINGAFLQGVPDDAGNAAITQTIIALAHNLKWKAIAEHVEAEPQRAFLRALDCDEMQGYLFRPPLPADQVVTVFPTT